MVKKIKNRAERHERWYLAHPFDSREYVRKWQIRIQKLFGVFFINPFYCKYNNEIWNENDKSSREYYKGLRYKMIVEGDINAIGHSKGMVAIIDVNKSIGTKMEILHCYQMHKPIYIICTSGDELHPWLKYYATKIFKNFESFEKAVKKGEIK